MSERLSSSMSEEESQRTSRLNESFSSSSISTSRGHQSNLTSIVNVPQSKTAQVVEGIVNMITETRIYKQIEDQSSKLFSSATSSSSSSTTLPAPQPLNEETLSRISIDASAFQQYRMRITGELSEYLRQKRMEAESIDVLSTIDLNSVLLRCFREVPAHYFDSNYHFDMKSHASRDVDKMNEAQEEFAGHLDEVEINLFYQIQHRFDEFLAVILELNSMQLLIDESLQSIAFIRTRNLALKQKLAQKGNGIVQIKKRILRCQSVLALLQLAATLHKSLPSINALITAGKFDLAVTLLQQTEAQYNLKFTKMLALNPLKESIFIYRAKLEKNIATSFMDKQLDYVVQELNFVKNPSLASQAKALSRNTSAETNSNDNSFDDNSLLSSSMLMEDKSNNDSNNLTAIQKNQRKNHLIWQHTTFHREIDLEEHISRIVNQSYDLDKFNNQAYRRKLIELLKGFREGFLNDMREYDQSAWVPTDSVVPSGAVNGAAQSSQSASLPFEKMNVDLFLNFIRFYCEILRRVALKQMGLNSTLVNSLIAHVIRQLEAAPRDLDDNINAFSKLSSTIEDVFSNVIQLFKYVNDWVDGLLKQRRLLDDDVSIAHFRKLTSIFDFWAHFIEHDAAKLCRIVLPTTSTAAVKNSKEVKKILKKFADYHEKIPMKSLEALRAELEKKFLDNFHKNSLTSIKAIIEADRWAAADVPFDFFDLLRYIFTPATAHTKKKSQKKKNNDQNSNNKEQGDTKHSSNNDLSENDDDDDEEEDEDKQAGSEISQQTNDSNSKSTDQTVQIRILKNSIVVSSTPFKVSASLLSLIKIIYEYVKIMEHFSSMRASACTKLNELLRFFNQYVRKLLMQRGAAWEVNSKHLGLSAVCLLFLLQLIHHLQIKIHSFAAAAASIATLTSNNIGQQTSQSNPIDSDFLEQTFGKTAEEIDVHAKMITKAMTTILNEEVKRHAQAFNELQWNNSKDNHKTPTQQTVALFKSFRMLNEVLHEFFQRDIINSIYDAPLDAIVKTYVKVLSTTPIHNKLAAKRISDEAQYILNQIKGSDYAKHRVDYLKQLQMTVDAILTERTNPILDQVDATQQPQQLSP